MDVVTVWRATKDGIPVSLVYSEDIAHDYAGMGYKVESGLITRWHDDDSRSYNWSGEYL